MDLTILLIILSNLLKTKNQKPYSMSESPYTILLVDDDPLIRLLGQELLEHLGYRTEVAQDGPQALELFRRLGGVDLVILDYNLPGQTGFQVLQELRRLDSGVRVLVASGFFSHREIELLKAAGAQGLIYKPYRVMELENRIRLVLSGMSGF
jgi:DNA-binding response OmpR family regulator